jgi:hypothetical protein
VPTTAWVRTYVTGLTYLTGNQSITVSGDATGSGTTSINLTLANTAVTPGTYGSATLVPVVTVDSKGRITSVTTASISGALTFTGDVTGTGTTGSSTQLTLANSGVTAGTFTKVTVDSKGRVTVGANATTSDVSEGTNLYYTDARVLAYLGANNYATQSYVSTQINNLVSGAPGLLDTLDELAQALGDDPNFATTTATSLGNRLRIDTASQGLNSTQQANGRTNLGLGTAALSATGDFATAAQGTKADTAHGWGNHASAGYLTSATAATTYLTQSTAASTYLTSSNAASTYLSQTSAGNTYLTLTNAASTYLSQTSASNTYLTLTNAASTYLSQTSASSNYLTLTNAASTYLTQSSASSSYVSLSGSYSNPSWITALGWGKITGTPTTISGYGITNAYTDAQIQNFFNGANAITGYNKSNWDTAYGWGNHASASYLTTSSAASTYVSLTGSYANPSWITSLAYSKITGVPAFLTSYTETDTLASVTGRGSTTSTSITLKSATTAASLGGFSVMGAGEFMSTGSLAGYFFENRSGGTVTSSSNWYGWYATSAIVRLFNGSTDIVSINGTSGAITAGSFIKSGGTSSQFLMADGSVSTNPGWLTGITSSQVTTALGYTPYNSTNPSGYITQTNALQPIYGDSGAYNLNISSQHATVRFSQGTWVNPPTPGNYSHVLSFNLASDHRTVQMYLGDVPGYLWWRMAQGPSVGFHPWERIWTSVSLTNLNQLTNGPGYITGYTETDTLASVTARGASTSTTVIMSGGSGTTPTLVLDRNIATPSNYYNGLQFEVRATSGTAGIGLHRNGFSHVGIYHNSTNELKFDMNNGTVILPATAGTLWGSGNLTNLNQLSNGPGYITGESDTLASVTARGATTSTAITTGVLTVNTGGTGTWGPFVVTSTSLWGDGATLYATIGAGGAAGIMINNPHVVWNSGNNCAAIRIGRSGGVSSGAYYEVGTGANDNFFIAKNSLSGGTQFNINSSGNATFSGTLSASNLSGTNTGDQTNISGNAGSATRLGAQSVNLNTGRTPGTLEFYDQPGGTGAPNGSWHNYISTRHGNAGNQYGFQIANEFGTETLLFRGWDGSNPLSWRTVWHSGSLTNLSQLTNGPGYITGITSLMVTNALGYTPMYQASRSGINVNAFNDTGLYRGSTGDWSNRPTIVHNGGALLQIDTHPGGYHSQLFFDSGGNRLYMRSADAFSWGSWVTMWHTGNLTNLNQLSNGPGYVANGAYNVGFNSGFTAYTPDGLFSANARPFTIGTPSGDTRIRLGYNDYGGGQYYGRIGFNGPTTWSIGHVGSAGNDFSIGKGVAGEMFKITNGGDYIFESGTSGTSGRIVFKTADNGDLNKYIMQDGYWTVIGTHSNEGLRVRDHNGNILLNVAGSSNGYPLRVGIGTTTPGYRLHVAGNMFASSEIYVGADGSTGYVASRVWLYSHDNYRGAGYYMSGTGSTWFAGTPYTNFDGVYMIARRAAAGAPDAADPSYRLWQVNNGGSTYQTGDLSATSLHAYSATGRVVAGSWNFDGMLFDTSRSALIARGNYPHVEIWSDVSNSNHGPTLRFGGYDNGSSGAYKAWNIGTAGSDLYFLDIGYGGNSNANPHAGIAGLGASYSYPGAFTAMRFHNNGNVGVGNFGTYGSGDNTPAYKFDVRGTGRFTDTVYANNLLLVNTTTQWNQEKFGIQISNSASWSSVPAMMRLTNNGAGNKPKITFTDSAIIDGWLGMVPVSNASYFVMGFSGYTEEGFRVYQNGSAIVSSTLTCDTLNTGNYINIGYNRNGAESISTSAFRGIDFHTTGDFNYYIGKPAGSWTQPLHIHFYTGIRLRSHSSYGGSQFFNINGSVTTASVNDGDNHLRGFYDIIAYASDKRLKHNIKPIENALDKVRALTGMTYQWNKVGNQYGWEPDTEVREAGVFAQDVEAVLPEAVKLAPFDNENGLSKSGENFLTVKYEKIVPLLIEAIKEQQLQIEKLQNKLDNVLSSR